MFLSPNRPRRRLTTSPFSCTVLSSRRRLIAVFCVWVFSRKFELTSESIAYSTGDFRVRAWLLRDSIRFWRLGLCTDLWRLSVAVLGKSQLEIVLQI